MHNGKVRLTVCAALLTFAGGLATPAVAQATPTRIPVTETAYNAPAVYGRAAYLIDATTGKVQLSKQASKRMPVASLTKVMTAFVVLKEAKLTDTVTITSADVEHADDNGATSADLRPGDKVAVKDLLYGLMLPSGADAAHALARTYGPGLDGFVAKMNATAHRLGLKDTRYVNADGLPMSGGDGYSTARDQARLAEVALRDATFTAVTSSRRHHVPSTADHRSYTWINTNKMLDTPGALGVKTGFTQAAGFCLTFAADRDGHRLVGVILGESVSNRRFETAANLLDWARTA
ncbi:D-alanyl-D-alanine carboxypeptidase family protein [Microtetraspora sp. NBRC 16547]|uniref:D-alanyl-D-alanine carboxypeptidase family protein n=1 Tax=Microtetraspora sp. NBRC 16547 TaxID=3030993 RepID=UPI0024A3011E|nr:D-alanyl-D-alanine carboxypeptidase family protein [Microtetraspora sp. NBRC 16547]GLW98456.1 D-alanyl-D-alanine carboxypeptidase [Microtetraspora sp. NBRC 16547]